METISEEAPPPLEELRPPLRARPIEQAPSPSKGNFSGFRRSSHSRSSSIDGSGPLHYSIEEWEFSKAMAETTKALSLQAEETEKRATLPLPLRRPPTDYEEEDTAILEIERRSSLKSPTSEERRSFDQTSEVEDDVFEVVKVYGSELKESENQKRIFINETISASTLMEEVMEKYQISGEGNEYLLIAIDQQGQEQVIPDNESPLVYHPDYRFASGNTLDRHFSFHIRRKKHKSGFHLANELLAKRIIEEEGSKIELKEDQIKLKVDALSNTPLLKSFNYKDISPDDQEKLVSEILKETITTLEENLYRYQTQMLLSDESSEALHYKALFSGALSSLSNTVRQANIAYQRLQALKQKESPLVIVSKGYNVESIVEEYHPLTSKFLHNLSQRSNLSLLSRSSSGRSFDESFVNEGESYIDSKVEPYLHKQNNPFFYKKHFYKNSSPGLNFLGEDSKLGPICVSVIKERKDEKPPYGRYRVLIWTREGCYLRFLPSHSPGYLRGEVLADLISSKLLQNNTLTWVPDQDLCASLLKMEEDQSESTYKFGVVYVKEGQMKEDDMFANNKGSPAFEEFLGLLGEKITLQNWIKYSGGLDVKTDSTGTHSIYRCWKGIEIMFHVSTLLPHDPTNSQQLARKRHIGNDIGIIVFIDSKTPYFPDTITSRFNHVFAVVRANPDNTYNFEIATKDDVPPFGPKLKLNKYERNHAFIELLIIKLINGQNSAYKAPAFREKLKRTREFLLNDLLSKYTNSGPMAEIRKRDLKKSKKEISKTLKKISDIPSSPTSDKEKSPTKAASFRMRLTKGFPRRPTFDSATLRSKLNGSSVDVNSEREDQCSINESASAFDRSSERGSREDLYSSFNSEI